MSSSVCLHCHPKPLISSVKSERFCSRSARRDWPRASQAVRLGFSEALQTYPSRWWKSELQALGIAPGAFHFLSCHKLSCKDVLSKHTFWFCNTSYLWLTQQHVADRARKTKGISVTGINRKNLFFFILVEKLKMWTKKNKRNERFPLTSAINISECTLTWIPKNACGQAYVCFYVWLSTLPQLCMLILSPHANRTPSLVSIIRNRHLRAGFCPSFLALAKITYLVLRGKKRQKCGMQLAYESPSYLQTVSADSR